MSWNRKVIGAGLIGLLTFMGCDPPQAPPTVDPDGAAAPTEDAVQATTAQPPATRPAASHIVIDRQPHEFPAARLQLIRRDDQTFATLFSDDPREALRPDFSGNSFYLEMTLDAMPPDLSADGWAHKSLTSERQDTVNGIFLNGTRVHLQPFDVRVEFEGDLSGMTVHLDGYFFAFRGDSATDVGRMVLVHAQLPVVPEIRK